MILGDLIDTLACFPPYLLVRYDNGKCPTEFFSWRGNYEELTLHEGSGWDPLTCSYVGAHPITVEELWMRAEKADGATFKGYKGGQFKMNSLTPVWADPDGEYNHTAIAGLSLHHMNVIIHTLNISDYCL